MINYRGQSGPVASFGSFNTSPDWQGRAWVTYARNRFTSTFETRYIGSGKLNAIWLESPPVAPGGNAYPTNPVFFDTIGRRFRVGVRIAF